MRWSTLYRLLRVASLVVLAVIGTSALTYFAPGYFSDAREMDSSHQASAQVELKRLQNEQSTILVVLRSQILHWSHGDLGTSRQSGLPVTELLKNALPSSLGILATAVCSGWLFAIVFSVPLSLWRIASIDVAVAILTASLLAIPVGALAVLCLLGDHDRPALVLAAVIGVRDLKILHRNMRAVWQEPYLLHARAQGFTASRILSAHVFPALKRELVNIAVMSFTLALSALVPVEVIFDRSGIGKLAWSAAMNRDLPVLVATTALVAASVGLTSLACDERSATERSLCAE